MAGENKFEIIPHFVQCLFRLCSFRGKVCVGSLYDPSLRKLISFTNSNVHTLQHAGMNDFKHNSLYSDSEAERRELVDKKTFFLFFFGRTCSSKHVEEVSQYFHAIQPSQQRLLQTRNGDMYSYIFRTQEGSFSMPMTFELVVHKPRGMGPL